MSWKNQEAKEEAYKLLLLQQKALLEGETDLIANLANSSALLNQTLQETVFAGYYLFKNDELISRECLVCSYCDGKRGMR